MNFRFKPVERNGIPFGRCGIWKEENLEVPDIPTYPLDDTVDKESKEPDWKIVHRGADEYMEKMADEIKKVTRETRKNTDKDNMIKGIIALDTNLIYESIPWNGYDDGIENTKRFMGDVSNDVGKNMVKTLPEEYQKGFKFETNSERAVKWVDRQGAKMVREVGGESKKAIRREIRRAIREGLGADETANNLIDLIGLTERQAGAVSHLRKNMLENEFSQKRIEIETKRYSKRLLDYRASNIARTELMTAANQGHLEMLRQGIDQELIPEDVKKVWIVTPDDRLCKYCNKMDGQKRNINEEFSSSVGNIERPPLHPSCRCAMGVEYD